MVVEVYFNRTVYVPSERVIIISGCIDKDPNQISDHTYEWTLGNNAVQFLEPIPQGRSSFGIYYKYNDSLIYVIGG